MSYYDLILERVSFKNEAFIEQNVQNVREKVTVILKLNFNVLDWV